MTQKTRTRIAPSPTGAPHIGTAYIALHNYAFARSKKGEFVLRIEDTDQERSTPESEKQILETLQWLGLEWDEGPGCQNPRGPYRQSERLNLYAEHAQHLIDQKKAYRCFCDKERLSELRKQQMEAKAERLGYDGHCRHLKPEEIQAELDKGRPHVIRLLVESEGQTSFFDHTRNEDITFDNSTLDDQILMKADGFPTYHLANVVDDHLMEITDVLRGEEWISSTPKHILLYQAFGWEAPRFHHLPLLRNSDKSKISKRKNPTSLLWFMACGYTREALVNFLGLMGYSLKDGREFFSKEELIEEYDCKRISTTAPIFDFSKLDRINGQHIMSFDQNAFLSFQQDCLKHLISYTSPLFDEIQKRCKSRSDLDQLTRFLFQAELPYDKRDFDIKKLSPENSISFLSQCAKALAKSNVTSSEDFEALTKSVIEKSDSKAKDLYMLLRLSLMNSRESLPLFPVMAFLGPHLSANRLKQTVTFLKKRD